jgi:GNAT superfamily N-acetyltransferase
VQGLEKPAKLHPSDNIDNFDCGREPLNRWLKERALRNAERGISQTFVVRDRAAVTGYYSLAGGSVYHADAIRKVKGDAPDPVPVVILGRLAVDRHWQGQGIGPALLKDAVLRSASAADTIGLRAILVHAKDEQAANFYKRFGFRPSPTNQLTLMVTMREVVKSLES